MTEKQKRQLLEYLKFVLPTIENNNKEQGYLWINNPKNNFNMQRYFNTYAEGVALIEKYRHNQCYIGIATTNNKEDWKTENIVNRSTIFIDIDEEGLDIKDIYDRCKKVGLFAHMVVNSGRGWHIYLKLDNNYPIEDIVRVNTRIVELFNADDNARVTTQIARVPFTKNFRVDAYASIVNANNQVRPYTLKYLDGHKPIEFKNNNTELEFDKIEDLYCFSQLVKNGVSKNFRNKAFIFIASACKYANISESKALQYAYECNDNCSPPDTKSNVIKVIRSIYDNTSIVKPCTTEFGQKLCSTQCKCRLITADDVLNKVEETIDKDVQVGFTKKIFESNIKLTRVVKKVEKVERGTMLNKLNGSEILVLSELKTFRNNVHTIESLVDRTKLSKPTVTKSLDTLESLGIVSYTKQSINKSSKPTKVYVFNEESTKRYKEIVYVGRGLFICRINKLITDSDMKVYLALKYLKDTRQTMTQLDIERVSGVARTKINTSLKNLEYRDIIRVDKIKTNVGHCNDYTLKL